MPIFRRSEERQVDRILVSFLRRERAREKHIIVRRLPSGITPVTANWFIVTVPVLSTQSTSIVAASSAALRRVTRTTRFASSFDPTAMLTVNITIRFTTMKVKAPTGTT
jgi:hypothetical protein